MKKNKQQYLADLFQAMHIENDFFILPNIWNVGSAVIFEKQGYEAVATTSAGVAYALGYPDGEDVSIDDLIGVVSQITKRINIPLSVDFERGYSESLNEIEENAKGLLEAGVVGLNIEDGKSDGSLDDIDTMVAKVKTLSELKVKVGIDFVINARTCTYWLDVGDEATKLKMAIERGNAFRKAGADCIFIPGAMNEDTVKSLVNGIDAPINIILNPVYNDVKGIKQIGVRRLSLGSGPVRATYDYLIKMAADIKANNFSKIIDNTFSYGQANAYFDQ